MKKYGNCNEDCVVIGLLQGRRRAFPDPNLRDEAVAEALNHEPRACERLQEECTLGGPHRIFRYFGEAACSSEIARDLLGYFERENNGDQPLVPHYSEEGLDEVAVAMWAQSSL